MKRRFTLFFVAFAFLILCLTPIAQASDNMLKMGSTGSSVVELQIKLSSLGYSAGTADGIFGPKTQAAVKTFQSSTSLTPDGIVGPLTQNALNSAYAKVRTTEANDIVSTAQKYYGYPYQWGGTSPTTGFDCSGFTKYVFAQNGITLPRISRDQYTVGTSVSFSNLLPGDLVFFSCSKSGIVDHVGIYIGNNQFINASSSKGVTAYTFGTYWKSVYLGAKRVV
ncbi:NLP/P60 protein [Syntrophobotulus glycolicus DSM 8271]|uniref:NLP/P60 protein n=1 Tax=Syntrophobotulus glycolicus (strain DSM 8271 / FlGlyR) TaxID=645991 RepID=F0SYR1_SYNGF|nr:NlpC/P60 family protein [Syntrophobotulus glycolicus]ADY54862.1 NLP/P60 protein [Syntrophobotulus glycolicus DSM 8271]